MWDSSLYFVAGRDKLFPQLQYYAPLILDSLMRRETKANRQEKPLK